MNTSSVTARKYRETRRRTNQTKQWSSKVAMINCHSSGGRRASGGIATIEAAVRHREKQATQGCSRAWRFHSGACARNARDELFHGSGEASAVSWLWGRSRGRYRRSFRVEGARGLESGGRTLNTRRLGGCTRGDAPRLQAPGDYGQRAVVFWDPALLRAGRTQRRAIKRTKHRIVRPWQGRPFRRVAVATEPHSADRGRLSSGQTALKHAPR
jgi:hypothetical protein